MKIRIIPTSYDNEKIEEINKARKMFDGEAWEEYCYDRVNEDEEWLDALYFASEDGDEALEKWEQYFHDLLTDDKKYYFAADMVGIDY